MRKGIDITFTPKEFRAWIPKSLEGVPMMFYQGTQYLGSFLRRANQFASGLGHDKYGEGKFVLLQYTGLKDKNGKKIYEGDTLQIPDNYEEYGQLAGERREIYFAAGGFRFKPRFNLNEIGNWADDAVEDCEVIGNIYENPELLTN